MAKRYRLNFAEQDFRLPPSLREGFLKITFRISPATLSTSWA